VASKVLDAGSTTGASEPFAGEAARKHVVGTSLLLQASERGSQRAIHWDMPEATVLAARNGQKMIAEIDVPPLEPTFRAVSRRILFGAPHAGMQGHQQLGLVLRGVFLEILKERRFFLRTQEADAGVILDAMPHPAPTSGSP
jgi:hypothetical protein